LNEFMSDSVVICVPKMIKAIYNNISLPSIYKLIGDRLVKKIDR